MRLRSPLLANPRFFALPSNTADPFWEQIPWVPASGVLQMDEPTRHKYLVAAEEDFLPDDEAVDEDMQMPHHGDMLRVSNSAARI